MKYKPQDLTREQRRVTNRHSDFQANAVVFVFVLACVAVLVVTLLNNIPSMV